MFLSQLLTNEAKTSIFVERLIAAVGGSVTSGFAWLWRGGSCWGDGASEIFSGPWWKYIQRAVVEIVPGNGQGADEDVIEASFPPSRIMMLASIENSIS